MTERASLYDAENTAREIARKLGASMPKGWGFFLCLASFGENGFTTYLSNVERSCAGSMMLEILEKWKQDPETWDNVTKEYAKAKTRKQSEAE